MKKDATLFKRSIWYFVGLNLIALSVVLNAVNATSHTPARAAST